MALSLTPTLTTTADGRAFDTLAWERPKNPMLEPEDCLTCWSLSINVPISVHSFLRVEIALAYRDELTQQKGYIHGGIVGMIADTACGYAAYSLMPAHSSPIKLANTPDTREPA